LSEFLEILKQITWTDILDIVLVAVFIYYLLKFLIGTRGWQILIGLLFLLLLWIFAKSLNLITLSWIFDNIWAIGVFLIIVVFQPELRRALAKIGEGGIFTSFFLTKKKIIDEVIRASTFLAERKIGALIVFERGINLDNYVEGCVKLNADISLELIITIFIPQTPLHDGAIIIKDNKIASARCFLPLTINPYIDKNIGTRHRAAIGISEETDAIALVVSEEKGEISVAIEGKLYRNLDALQLKDILSEHLGLYQNNVLEIDKYKKIIGKRRWRS